ncbi:hypothetical protein FHG64_00450 [Antarcticibacterium flavum]|uniref:Uncharacterized protein n=1 Tax=Antarcticibacterium flavum TaxID=2058175 RepID=A0A5B7WY95_9FLAO|nr:MULTISPECIES: hypothetical protein [Antarcticibacterium]MCM4160817.1 hypothetical protein [Antarcticibacterium sp. W02-3]QCY67985.1 hypothetical protein FHG64_00450 [Antarcticibacterium flavum]
MASVICTLFEGDYHYGLAALANSLNCQGYKGPIYAGYRGALPPWANEAVENTKFKWKGSKTLLITKQLQLHFLPLETEYHLTNYKPNFLLNILEVSPETPQKLFYFDPDIVLVSHWSFFEEWLDSCDVGLFEDVNSPLSKYHPRRIAWRKYYGSFQIPLIFKDPTYANGGFVGVTSTKRDFLVTWQNLQELMAPAIGGLNRSSVSGDPIQKEANTPYAPFMKSDQDALNATVEAWDGVVSFIGKEGMALGPGEAIIPHALGKRKPWHINPVFHALAGYPPTIAHKAYWEYSKGFISAHSRSTIAYYIFNQRLASFIGRFYCRN